MATYVKKIDGNVIYAQRAEETGTGVNIDSALADKANKVANPQEGHLVGLNAQGELVDAGVTPGDYKTKQQPVSDPSMDGYTTAFIDTISQTDNGVITVTKKGVPTASSETAGLMSTNDKGKLDSVEYGANNYQHPTIYPSGEAPTLGLYKVALNEAGHVASVTNVVKQDIVDLGIPGSDTTYTASNGITLDGTTFKHTNNITGGTAGPGADTTGNTFTVTNVVYDDNGHITQTTTNQHTSFPLPSSDGEFLLGVTNDTSSTGSAPDWGELTKGLVGGNGILLDENNDPLIDENNNPLLDEHTAELWTEYKRTGFAAARAIADEDGNNIKNALDDKVERVFIENTEIAKTGHDVHIPMAVSESDTSNKKNGAMSSVDKYKVDAIEFPTTEDPDYLYDDNNSCNKICKVGYPVDGGYGGGYEEMLRIGYTARQTGDNVNVWLGSLADLNDGKVGFYKLVGEITEPSDYRNASNWEPYNIGTIETSNTIDDKMVYLDTVNGNDSNTGLTVDRPVQTVYRAFRVFANEFYYGNGKTARIRVLNDNASVLLDNSYDDDNYTYFDWIAFYGTGNVTFVYDLEADDQGKIVDNKYRNNLWAEFDGDITINSPTYKYSRLVHLISKQGSVTFSGIGNDALGYQKVNDYMPEIYANAATYIIWDSPTPTSSILHYVDIMFYAGQGILIKNIIEGNTISLECGKPDIYLPAAVDSPTPTTINQNTATIRHIVFQATVKVNSMLLVKCDYIDINSPISVASSSGTVWFKQNERSEYMKYDTYTPYININAPISCSNTSSVFDVLRIDFPYGNVSMTATVDGVRDCYINSLKVTDLLIGSLKKADFIAVAAKDGISGTTQIKAERVGLFATSISLSGSTVCDSFAATVYKAPSVGGSYIGPYCTLSGIKTKKCHIDNFNSVTLDNSWFLTDLSITNVLETRCSVVYAHHAMIQSNRLFVTDKFEVGGVDIDCMECQLTVSSNSSGYFNLVSSITYPGDQPVSTADVINNTIHIGRLTYYVVDSAPTSGIALLWINKENSDITSRIDICSATPFRFDCATVKLNSKINMMNNQLFFASTIPANIDMKVVSDFDTYGSNPGTIPGYDYKYIVISDAVGITVHTQTLNS